MRKVAYKNVKQYNEEILNNLKIGYHAPNMEQLISSIYEMLNEEVNVVGKVSDNPRITFYNHPTEYKEDKEPSLDNAKISKRLATDWITVVRKKEVNMKETKDYLYSMVDAFKASDRLNALYKRVHEVKNEGTDSIFNAKYFYLYPLLRPFTENKFYHTYCEFLLSGVWWYKFTKDEAHIILTPQSMNLDPTGQLHSAIPNKPAVRWNDGQTQNYLWGVHFDDALWKKVVNKKITSKECLKISNIEQRGKALKIIGYEDLIKKEYFLNEGIKPSHIRNRKTGELEPIEVKLTLYSIPGVFKGRNGNDIPVKVLKYDCPSTNRTYFDTVHPDSKDAVEAMARKFKLSKEEYLNELTIES